MTYDELFQNGVGALDRGVFPGQHGLVALLVQYCAWPDTVFSESSGQFARRAAWDSSLRLGSDTSAFPLPRRKRIAVTNTCLEQ